MAGFLRRGGSWIWTHLPILSKLGKFNVIKFLQSFTNEGGWAKVKGSSCELSLSPATLGKG